MIYTKEKQYTIYNASCLDVMDNLEENSIDCIVTDPPYEINFMNKGWDNTGIAFNVETWKKALRVLKPGGYLLAFNHSRTFHRMAVSIEDAGFEIRDTIMWLYGSGFPKSHNVSKAINKIDGVDFEITEASGVGFMKPDSEDWNVTKNHLIQKGESSERAKQWNGYGTALKPAFEPIVMARKPFKTSVADNVLEYGTGAINIDECRVGTDKIKGQKAGQGFNNVKGFGNATKLGNELAKEYISEDVIGRFPANVIHDGSKEATKDMWDWETDNDASRYFYTAKASKKDRDEGLDREATQVTDGCSRSNLESARKYGANSAMRKNIHPTVKPTDLMQYLVRLVAPPGATVMDIFMGSGSTGKATMIENVERDSNYHFIGIDLEKEYCEIAQARIEFGINYREIEEMEQRTQITRDENGNEYTLTQESLFD